MGSDTYADKLKVALECDDWSQAKLVKELAARTGNAPESERSALRGYLRGSVPRPDRAELIAEIMGSQSLLLLLILAGQGRLVSKTAFKQSKGCSATYWRIRYKP